MDQGDQGHQADQHHGQGAGHVRVGEHVAGDQRADADRDHVEVAGGQRVHRGVGAEGVGQEDDEGTQQRRGQHRDADVSPVLPAVGAEQRGGLAPVLAQGVEGRVEQHHPEGDLEIGVEDYQTGLRVEIEVVDPAGLLEQQGQRAVEAEQDDEGERQRYPGEVAGHVGEGHDEVAQAAVDVAQRMAAEHRDEQAEQARPAGDLQAVADRLAVEGRAEQLEVVGQAPGVAGLQAVQRDPGQRRYLENHEERREGQQEQQRQPFAGESFHGASSSRQTGLSWAAPRISQSVPQRSVCSGCARSSRLKASPKTNSGTSRSSSRMPPWLRSSFIP